MCRQTAAIWQPFFRMGSMQKNYSKIPRLAQKCPCFFPVRGTQQKIFPKYPAFIRNAGYFDVVFSYRP